MKCAYLATAITLAVSVQAAAQQEQNQYVSGTNVYVCPDKTNKDRNYDCRVQGTKTPRFKQLPFVDRETGKRTLETVHAYIPLRCGEYGCAVVNNWQGFEQGELLGRGAPGIYLIDSGWYLDYDAEGKTTAYRMDVGPQRGQAAYAANTRPANYGKESCFDDEIASIQEEDPNFPISFDMMNEIRVGCGLPKEE